MSDLTRSHSMAIVHSTSLHRPDRHLVRATSIPDLRSYLRTTSQYKPHWWPYWSSYYSSYYPSGRHRYYTDDQPYQYYKWHNFPRYYQYPMWETPLHQSLYPLNPTPPATQYSWPWYRRRWADSPMSNVYWSRRFDYWKDRNAFASDYYVTTDQFARTFWN